MPPEVETPQKPPNPADLARAELSALLPDGARLCLVGGRLALFDASLPAAGRWLSAEVHARLDGGPLFRKLELADKRYSVGNAVAERCLQMVGLARLGVRAQGPHQGILGPEEALLAAAIDATLGRDELLLLVGPTSVKLSGVSAVVGAFREAAQLVVSERQCLLLAVSRAGEVVVEQLLPPFAVDGDALVSSTRRVELPKPLLPFRDVLVSNERALEAARIAYARGLGGSAPETLISELAARGEPRARWIGWFLALLGDPKVSFPEGLDASAEPEKLFERWSFPDALLSSAIEALPKNETFDALAVAWAERVWRQRRAQVGSDHLLPDLAFAERLVSRGQVARARSVADDALAGLPRLPVQDVERPGSPANEVVRRRIDLLTVRLQCSADAEERLEQRLRLLRLEPLSLAHLSAIAGADGALAARASEVHSCLSSAVALRVDEPTRRMRPLPADVLERRLRADLNIEAPKLPSRVTTWIAKERRPDPALLKQYCERVTRTDAAVVRIVDAAATLLGLGHVDIYVSRGEGDVGVRAFDGARPFILIGGRHFETDSTYAMTARELCFAVASELFHVRVGNVRLGTRDVVRGALHKGRAGLDLVIGVLPLFKGLKLADRIGMATAKVSLPHVGRAIEVGRQAFAEDEADAHGLSPAAEKLLTAQRELQLWADRAGILCAGSFAASVRAITATRHDTARAAREFEHRGVLEVIEEQRAGEPEAFDYLLLRLASLSSFYISDEYGALDSVLGD